MSINSNAEKKSEPKKQIFFVDGWLRDPAFQGWLSKDRDNTKARYTYCHKTIELSSSGRSALTDHAKKKHIAIVDKRKNFCRPKSKPSTEESTESGGETIASNKRSQKTFEMHFHNADCIKMEIYGH